MGIIYGVLCENEKAVALQRMSNHCIGVEGCTWNGEKLADFAMVRGVSQNARGLLARLGPEDIALTRGFVSDISAVTEVARDLLQHLVKSCRRTLDKQMLTI